MPEGYYVRRSYAIRNSLTAGRVPPTPGGGRTTSVLWLRGTGEDLARGHGALELGRAAGRLSVVAWGGRTTIHGRLVGIEWPEKTLDGYGLGIAVDSTKVDWPTADDLGVELAVTTTDWLPHD